LERDRIILSAQDTYDERIKKMQQYRDELNETKTQLEYFKSLREQGYQDDPNADFTEIDKIINTYESKLLISQGMVANASQALSAEVMNVFTALSQTLSGNITPQIESEIGKIVSALDFSDLDSTEIEIVQERLVSF